MSVTELNCETLKVGYLYLTGIKLEKATWSFTAQHCITVDPKQSES
jgi:hypothetical protein